MTTLEEKTVTRLADSASLITHYRVSLSVEGSAATWPPAGDAVSTRRTSSSPFTTCNCLFFFFFFFLILPFFIFFCYYFPFFFFSKYCLSIFVGLKISHRKKAQLIKLQTNVTFWLPPAPPLVWQPLLYEPFGFFLRFLLLYLPTTSFLLSFVVAIGYFKSERKSYEFLHLLTILGAKSIYISLPPFSPYSIKFSLVPFSQGILFQDEQSKEEDWNRCELYPDFLKKKFLRGSRGCLLLGSYG